MRPYPPCPICAGPLTRERVLADGYVREPSRSTVDVSCAGCLSAIHVETEPHDDAEIHATVLAPGAQVTRLRDEVVAMRERGVLEAEIPALLADPAHGLLLGVPEIANEVLALGRKSVRIAKASYAMPQWFFTVWGECPWRLDRYSQHLSEAEKKAAIREGEFGGFVVPPQGSRLLVLPLQKFQVAGFYDRKARVPLPRFASGRLPNHPGFQIEWDQLVPDRSRRPL